MPHRFGLTITTSRVAQVAGSKAADRHCAKATEDIFHVLYPPSSVRVVQAEDTSGRSRNSGIDRRTMRPNTTPITTVKWRMACGTWYPAYTYKPGAHAIWLITVMRVRRLAAWHYRLRCSSYSLYQYQVPDTIQKQQQ